MGNHNVYLAAICFLFLAKGSSARGFNLKIDEPNTGVDRRQENVPDKDVKDLLFAILDKNQDKKLSVQEFYLLNSWAEVSSNFGDIYHKFWSGRESSITQSEWNDLRFTDKDIKDMTKPFEDIIILA
eukprot:XP_011451535.1 PREDICTED: uncharacterized protein LOC105345171 [Crassostrea gigas]